MLPQRHASAAWNKEGGREIAIKACKSPLLLEWSCLGVESKMEWFGRSPDCAIDHLTPLLVPCPKMDCPVVANPRSLRERAAKIKRPTFGQCFSSLRQPHYESTTPHISLCGAQLRRWTFCTVNGSFDLPVPAAAVAKLFFARIFFSLGKSGLEFAWSRPSAIGQVSILCR